MSKREDIIDGKDAAKAKYGLIYSCLCGWIDLGHALPHSAAGLWKQISTPSVMSGDGEGFMVEYAQTATKWKIGAGGKYWVANNLKPGEKERVALAIFLEVSHKFESLQSLVPDRISDSGYSGEDLVSNLIGFYRAVRKFDYVPLCKPVSKDAALKIWDDYGAIGSHKNRGGCVFLFPCADCGRDTEKVSIQLPSELDEIKPAEKGKLWRNWSLTDRLPPIKISPFQFKIPKLFKP